MTPGTRDFALFCPVDCAEWLSHGGVVTGAIARALPSAGGEVVYDVWFQPLGVAADCGYPIERARILVSHRGDPLAVPYGSRRTWHHRYSSTAIGAPAAPLGVDESIAKQSLLGGLCLWFPGDPLERRWSWSWGFDAYVRIVRDHLWYEEDARRLGLWPIEDAPHGWPSNRSLTVEVVKRVREL